jgi:hypothetical protein
MVNLKQANNCRLWRTATTYCGKPADFNTNLKCHDTKLGGHNLFVYL